MKRCLVALSAIAVLLASCGRTEPEIQEGPVFSVDPDMLGPTYANAELQLELNPPLEWEILAETQRQAVLDALLDSEEVGGYSTQVVDIFFDTESLSFLSVSRISNAAGVGDRAAYARAFAQELGLDETGNEGENAIVARMDFELSGLDIVQFRHVQENRVTFTLLFGGAEGSIRRLDYSIPSEHYQDESVKLESSIGSIQDLNTQPSSQQD